MVKQYLDYAGLEVLWGKIKTADADNASKIESIKNSISFEAENYTEALSFATLDNVGKNIIVKNPEDIYAAGPYIVMSENSIQCLLCDTEAELSEVQNKVAELEREFASFGPALQTIQTSLDNLKSADDNIINSIKELEKSILDIDLSNYYNKTEIDDLLDDKMDEMGAISVEDIESLS
jgi:hypothetical protein